MDHIVYLNHKARELESLINGTKIMIIRGAMGRKIPYGVLNIDDVIYFAENTGDGLVKAKAVVMEVLNSEKLSREESIELVNAHQNELKLDKAMFNRFAGKRFIVLIKIRDFETIEKFNFDRSGFSNMDDWLPVVNINDVKLK
jgi:hypothetical protein